MTYQELTTLLFKNGFTRVERDDRMLDAFPDENSEKGVQMWECWQKESVYIFHIRLPYTKKRIKLFRLPRKEMEKMFYENTISSLGNEYMVAEKEVALKQIEDFSGKKHVPEEK